MYLVRSAASTVQLTSANHVRQVILVELKRSALYTIVTTRILILLHASYTYNGGPLYEYYLLRAATTVVVVLVRGVFYESRAAGENMTKKRRRSIVVVGWLPCLTHPGRRRQVKGASND